MFVQSCAGSSHTDVQRKTTSLNTHLCYSDFSRTSACLSISTLCPLESLLLEYTVCSFFPMCPSCRDLRTSPHLLQPLVKCHFLSEAKLYCPLKISSHSTSYPVFCPHFSPALPNMVLTEPNYLVFIKVKGVTYSGTLSSEISVSFILGT